MGKEKRLKKSMMKTSKCEGNEKEDKENEYLLQVLDLKSACADWDNLFSKSVESDRRMLQWQYVTSMGKPLLDKFAWAIPSNSAIGLLTKFSPLVEIGAGKGYWAHLVKEQGGYILPIDIVVPKKKDAWTKVYKGTPSSILSPTVAKNKDISLPDLNLFLCYPDQGCEVGLPSIEAFQQLTDSVNGFGQGDIVSSSGLGMKRLGGGYIIHVGELLTTGCISGSPQAPWGRTSSPEFQERLYKDYHCVLSIPLESFPFSRDFLTVWKRTVIFDASQLDFYDGDSKSDMESITDQRQKRQKVEHTVQEYGSTDEQKDDETNSGDSDIEENEDEWADIPADERLSHQMFITTAPCMEHLLKEL